MLFDAIFSACRCADLFKSRKSMDVFCSVVEEIGELSTELNVASGFSYKDEDPDGVLGEVVDVISSVTDLAYVVDDKLTEYDLLKLVCPKLDKWLGKLTGRECHVFVTSLHQAFHDQFVPGASVFDGLFKSCLKDNITEWIDSMKTMDMDKYLKFRKHLNSGDSPVDITAGKAECGNEKFYDGPNSLRQSVIDNVYGPIVVGGPAYDDAPVVGCLVNEQDFVDAARIVSGRVEAEKPTACDSLIDDTGTGPVRMGFLELALGARFRFVVDGVPNSQVWIKLSNFNSQGEKVGLIAEFDSNYIIHKNWVGQSICCAEDTVEKCEKLVVELVC